MGQRLLTKRGRLVLPVIGIGLTVLVWARLNGFDSGPKALIVILLMSVLAGVVQFIVARVEVQEERSEPQMIQETMPPSPPSLTAQVGYEGPRLLSAPPSNPEQEH